MLKITKLIVIVNEIKINSENKTIFYNIIKH